MDSTKTVHFGHWENKTPLYASASTGWGERRGEVGGEVTPKLLLPSIIQSISNLVVLLYESKTKGEH